MKTFSNVSSYCQCLKTFSNQLLDVGAPMNNHRLVLQLFSGLTDAYYGIATLIRSRNPLPSFHQPWSMLILEEDELAKMMPTVSLVAYHTTQQCSSDDSS